MKNFDSALDSAEKALKVVEDPAVRNLKAQIVKSLKVENEKFKRMWKGKLIPKTKEFKFAKILKFFNPFNLHFRVFPFVI